MYKLILNDFQAVIELSNIPTPTQTVPDPNKCYFFLILFNIIPRGCGVETFNQRESFLPQLLIFIITVVSHPNCDDTSPLLICRSESDVSVSYECSCVSSLHILSYVCESKCGAGGAYVILMRNSTVMYSSHRLCVVFGIAI